MFTKTTKRVLSLILCVLMFVPFMTMASAYVSDPYSDEITSAREKFTLKENCGEITYKDGGFLGMGGTTKTSSTRIRIYSPGKAGKFPVVFLIGKLNSEEVNSNDLRLDSFAFWANDEYQSRFYNSKAAYIVYVCPPQNKALESVELMMEEFLTAYSENIDLSRLYMVGWDKGCDLAVKLAKDTDNHIAALVLSSPREIISEYPSIPVWLIASKNDRAVSYDLTQCWTNLKNNTSTDLDKIRFTSFNSFNSLGEKNHDTWEYVAYDINKYTGEQSGAKTVNGRDQGIDATSVIEWMSKFGTDYGAGCTCPCHGTDDMMEKIKWFFKWMISMMLKIEKNRPCKCGVKDHW